MITRQQMIKGDDFMIKFMKEILDKLLSVILSLLPLSPFADAIDNLSQLPYLAI